MNPKRFHLWPRRRQQLNPGDLKAASQICGLIQRFGDARF